MQGRSEASAKHPAVTITPGRSTLFIWIDWGSSVILLATGGCKEISQRYLVSEKAKTEKLVGNYPQQRQGQDSGEQKYNDWENN